ncbi:30S ribosomal protein S6 [Candidatus Dependentiae bacterium]
MDRYEILILTIPELTKDEESSLENQLEKFLNDHKGSIISFDRWGKYRLSYPVRHNDYGVYFLMRFEVSNDKDFLTELRNLFYIKFNDLVMRHLVTRLKKEGSLEYKKPPSLEDIPKKPIGFFDKKDSRRGNNNFARKPFRSADTKTVVSPESNEGADTEVKDVVKESAISSDKQPEETISKKVVVEEKIETLRQAQDERDEVNSETSENKIQEPTSQDQPDKKQEV